MRILIGSIEEGREDLLPVTSRRVLAIGLIALPGLAFARCTNDGPTQTPTASPAQIRSVLAEAKRGAAGSFTATYDVTVRYGRGIVRTVVVNVAQRSTGLFSYRMKPSLGLSGPGGPPASYSYEVFYKSGADTQPGAGIYSCRRRTHLDRWVCQGPDTGIGMGTTAQLLGPYPPQALLLGLDNAAVTYTGVPAPPATRPEPAFLTTRHVAGQALRCLQFGATRVPLGSVCLRANGLIATYRLSDSVTSGTWASAILRSYSPRLARNAFELPAKPTGISS